jgi:hypothetical protein
MPIDVQWDDDNQTVIRYVFKTPWTWTEYHAAIEQAWTMAKSVDHPTDTITDMSGSRLLPDNLFANIKRSMVEIPDSTQTVVLVGGGAFMDVMLGVFRRLYPRQVAKFHMVRTLEEARTLIRERRAAFDAAD